MTIKARYTRFRSFITFSEWIKLRVYLGSIIVFFRASFQSYFNWRHCEWIRAFLRIHCISPNHITTLATESFLVVRELYIACLLIIWAENFSQARDLYMYSTNIIIDKHSLLILCSEGVLSFDILKIVEHLCTAHLCLKISLVINHLSLNFLLIV